MSLAPTNDQTQVQNQQQATDPNLEFAQKVLSRANQPPTLTATPTPLNTVDNSNDPTLSFAQRVMQRAQVVPALTTPTTPPSTPPLIPNNLPTASSQPVNNQPTSPPPLQPGEDRNVGPVENFAANLFGQGIGGTAADIASFFHQDNAVKSIHNFINENMPTNPDLKKSFLDSTLPRFIGGVIPAVGAAAGAVAALPEEAAVGTIVGVGKGVSSVVNALQSGGGERETVKAAGASPAQQLIAQGVGTGVGAAMGNLLAEGPLAKYLQGRFGQSMAQKIIGGVVRSGGEMALLQVGENVAAKATGYDPNRPLSQGVGAAAVVGGLSGGIHGVLSDNAPKPTFQPQPETPITGAQTTPEGDVLPFQNPRVGPVTREPVEMNPGDIQQPTIFRPAPREQTTLRTISGDFTPTGDNIEIQVPVTKGEVPTANWDDIKDVHNPELAAKLLDKQGVLVQGVPDEVASSLIEDGNYGRLQERYQRQQAKGSQPASEGFLEPKPVDNTPLVSQPDLLDYPWERQRVEPLGGDNGNGVASPASIPAPAPTPVPTTDPISRTLELSKSNNMPSDVAATEMGFDPTVSNASLRQAYTEAPAKLTEALQRYKAAKLSGDNDALKQATTDLSIAGQTQQMIGNALRVRGIAQDVGAPTRDVSGGEEGYLKHTGMTSPEYTSKVQSIRARMSQQERMDQAAQARQQQQQPTKQQPGLTAADQGAGGNGKVNGNGQLPPQPAQPVLPSTNIDPMHEINGLTDQNTLNMGIGGVSGNAARLGMWGFGELVEQVSKGLVGEGEGLGALTRAAKVQAYAQWEQDVVGSQAGDTGKAIREMATKANRLSRSLQGRVANTMHNLAMQVRSWGISSSLRKELADFTQIQGSNKSFNRNFTDYMEGTNTSPMSAAAQAYITTGRNITDVAGRSLEQLRTLERKNGDPFYRAKDGKVAIRIPTAALRSLIHEGGPLYDEFLQELSHVNPGANIDEMKGELGQQVSGPTKDNKAITNLRTIDVFPDRMQLGGKMIDLLHSDPYDYWTHTFSHVFDSAAFTHVFIPNGGDIQPLREQFKDAGGNIDDLDNMLKSMNHIPLDPSKMPSSSPGKMTAFFQGSMNVFRMLALSANVLKHTAQTLQWGSIRGGGAYIDALTSAIANSSANSIELRSIGAMTHNEMDFSLHVDPAAYNQTVTGNLGKLSAIPVSMARDLNARIAGTLGLQFRDDLLAGTTTSTDFAALRTLGFTAAESRSLIARTASQELYNEIPRKLVNTQFRELQPSEKSVLAQSPRFKQWFPFQQYLQGTLKTWSNAIGQVGEAFKTGDPRQISGSLQVFARSLYGTTLAGAGAAYLTGLFFGRPAGPSNWQDPKQVRDFLFSAFGESMMSGPMSMLYHANPNQDPMALLGGVSFPVSIGENLYRAIARQGRFADKQPLDVAVEFLKSQAPVLNGPWGIHGTGLTADQRSYFVMAGMRDTGLDRAMQDMFKWKQDNGLAGDSGPSSKQGWDDFKSNMDNAYLDARNGKLNDSYNKLIRAGLVAETRQALGAKLPGSKGLQSVIKSLGDRQVLPGLSSQQKIGLMNSIGGVEYDKLVAHDFLMANLQQHYAALTGANTPAAPNVLP